MIGALLIAGLLCLLTGGVFFWLNLNTPVQSCIPALALPLGLCWIIAAVGMWIGS